MKILLGTYRLLNLGGTEMWTRVMYDALSKEHDVFTYAKEGNSLFPDMRPHSPGNRYDLAIINHHETMRALRKVKADSIIMNIHGTRPALEWPVLGADAYVAVSEWEQQFIPVRSTVIHNPIEVDRFVPKSPLSPTLQRVGMVSNYATPARAITEDACEYLGVEFRSIGMVKGQSASAKPEELMNWADLVIGVGRTALEALATGRNVYLMGLWGAGGMVTEENYSAKGWANWSGMERGTWPTPRQMALELSAGYDAERNLRPRVIAGHHPDLVARRYLQLAAAIPPLRRRGTRIIRRLPQGVMSPMAMTVLDPFLREFHRRRPIDGRPGVLSAAHGQTEDPDS